MAKKDHILIIDTETAIDEQVADFAAVVVDRKGNILTQCAVLIAGVFGDEKNPLFYDTTSPLDSIWNKQSLERRMSAYSNMLNSGVRMVASPAAVNRWLDKALHSYDPYLTAYNLSFDVDKCGKTGIDLTRFKKRFCLWAAAVDKWATTKKFKNFVLSQHAFNNPTKLGNLTYKTNAEIMARFVLENPELADEPHTALEDIIFYELPILLRLLQTTPKKKWLNAKGYNWREFQAKNHFTAI